MSSNGKHFQRNTLKKTTRGNHFGDTRAKLEIDIQEVLGLVMQINKTNALTNANEEQLKKLQDYEVTTEDEDVFGEAAAKVHRKSFNRYSSTSPASSIITLINSVPTCSKSDELKTLNIELITLVRKKFAVTLQNLIQHGLRSLNETRHLVPFTSCFESLQTNNDHGEYRGEDYTEMHAWDLLNAYYNLKNGDFYTETPAQKLSQSFNLDLFSEELTSTKQVTNLL